MASKILLGALYAVNHLNLNPLEYCLKAVGVDFDVLSGVDPEFKLLKQYVDNTYYECLAPNQQSYTLRHIVRLTKHSEQDTFRHDISNRQLLFHGSRTPNFLGILAQGLRVTPIEVQQNGNLLGKGIYFSDMLTKSI